MAKPPAGSSLLFRALGDSVRIRRPKFRYSMRLRGNDHFDWFTGSPDRVAGKWPTKKLVKKWDSLFGDVEPNAQATFEVISRRKRSNRPNRPNRPSEVVSKRKSVTFEMFKPELTSRGDLVFKVRGIDRENKDLLWRLSNSRSKRLTDASLFIDNGTTEERTALMKVWNDSGLSMQMRSLSDNAVFGNPTEVSGYTNAELDEGDIFFQGGVEGAEGVFELPITLKNGLKKPPLDVDIKFFPTNERVVGQCNENDEMSEEYGLNGPTTVYYSINGGATKSVEATCEMMM